MIPTDAQIRSACLSYRHDFGLLGAEEQETMMFSAKEWYRAWVAEFSPPKIVIPDIPTQEIEALASKARLEVLSARWNASHRIQDLLEANNRYLARARAAESSQGTTGPFAYLVVHPDLSEDHWSIQDDPVESRFEAQGFVSVPLFALNASVPDFVRERLQLEDSADA